MSQFALNCDCSYLSTDGSFVDYDFNANPPGPTGVVWWQSLDAGVTWTPVPCAAPPNNAGNPKFVSPLLQNGDQFWVSVRDTTLPSNFSIQSVTISVVFSQFAGNRATPQSALASPFQSSSLTDNITFDRTVFGSVINNPANGAWCQMQLVGAAYPPGNSKKSFEFSVGVVIVYQNASGQQFTRHFGIDPEMDVDNCGE